METTTIHPAEAYLDVDKRQVIDNLVALGQRHPFQRIGRRDLGCCPVWHQAEGKNDQTNDS